jgi:GTP-binding protein
LVTEIPGTTRDPVDVRIRYHGHTWVLIDTAGMRKRTKVKEQVEYYSYLRTHRIIENCDVACVFVTADEGLTQQDMRVIREVVDARKGILIVANKWDLVKGDKDKIKRWDEDMVLRLQGFPYIPVLTVSCTTNLRVRKVLEFVNHISEERKKRIPSSHLNRLIEDLNRQYQPPAVKGKRVRILYGTQVGTSPPKIAFFSNHPHLIKESYKRFIENRVREKFGFEGVPISMLFRKK